MPNTKYKIVLNYTVVNQDTKEEVFSRKLLDYTGCKYDNLACIHGAVAAGQAIIDEKLVEMGFIEAQNKGLLNKEQAEKFLDICR